METSKTEFSEVEEKSTQAQAPDLSKSKKELPAVSIRSRVDRTKKIAKEDRRLDTLANLFAAHSVCVATTIINGQLFVAANEIGERSYLVAGKNKIVTSIGSIYSYFQNYAKNPKVSEDSKLEIFQEICTIKRYNLTASTVPELASEIAKRVFLGDIPTLKEIAKEYGNSSSEAALLFQEFRSLLKDFKKIEETLLKDSILKKTIIAQDIKFLTGSNEPSPINPPENKDESDKTTKISKRKRDSTPKPVIVLDDGEGQKTGPPIHAEMKILAYIIANIEKTGAKAISKDIYIGISKLCCLHCRCMIDVANEKIENSIKVANEKVKDVKQKRPVINILTRGKHDCEFGGNWIPPSYLSQGYNEASGTKKTRQHLDKPKIEDEENISYVIGFYGHKLIQNISTLSAGSHVSMTRYPSSSEPETMSDEELNNIEQVLQIKLDGMNWVKNQQTAEENFKDSSLEKCISLTKVAIELCKNKLFKSIIKEITRSEEVHPKFFKESFPIIQKEIDGINSEKFQKIITDKNFFGEKITRIFSNYYLPTNAEKTAPAPNPTSFFEESSHSPTNMTSSSLPSSVASSSSSSSLTSSSISSTLEHKKQG
jgi:hypothetical protein